MVDPYEKELLTLIKCDDQSAIKILFEKYHAFLCNVAYRLVRDRDTAKDIVQDVFVKFWNNRKSTEITTSLRAYLKRSVINTSLNHLEKDQRYPKEELEKITNPPLTGASDQGLSSDELFNQLENALRKLPVRTRAVFILIRREEMSYKEVGESLNISVKAVEKEMMKALRLLREMLKNFLLALIITGPVL